MLNVFLNALLIADKEGSLEIDVAHLLAALNGPAAEGDYSDSAGPYAPVPHHDKPLSSEARAAIAAACRSD